jgi:aminomethyltransferase
LRWLTQNTTGLRVNIVDISEATAALALQGPMAARVLRAAADANIESLKYFRLTHGRIAGVAVDISRTGYTGDLGYEIWIPREHALVVWDALMVAGQAFELKPAGMLALDVARTEAGLLLLDVDYIGSRKALISSQRYTPYEMGLSRLVSLDKGPFVGRAALAEERRRGPRRQIAGLEIEWSEVESIHERLGLAPVAPAATSRVPVPIMRGSKQIGRATTTAWSPTLKRLIALATIDAPHYEEGTRVEFEITVEGVRHFAGARVVRTPFFNPPRKTATPPA